MLYLLHSTVRLGTTGRNSAVHYVGYAPPDEVDRRVDEHRRGVGRAKIVNAYLRAGARLLLTGVWLDGTKQDERRVKQHGHLEERCSFCLAQKKGLVWSPAIVRLNHLPKVSKRHSTKLQTEDDGLECGSTLPAENGSFHQQPTETTPTPSPYTTLTYHPALGGNVSGAIAPPDHKGSSFAGTKQQST